MNIENKKQVATILLAVGLGLVAAFLTSQYVATSVQQQTRALATEYTKQSATLQKELEMTKQELGKIVQQQQALEKQMKERPVVQAQAAQQPVQALDKEAFSVIMPPGKRAVTIQVDALAAVGGLISPGDKVDVIARLHIPEEETSDPKAKTKVKNVTTVLFQNLQVLAVGSNYKPIGGSELYAAQQKLRVLSITLAVTPEEAGLLAFTQTHADLQLSLRPPSEQGKEALQVASWGALSEYVLDHQGTQLTVPGEEAPPSAEKTSTPTPQPKAKKSSAPIEIFRGGKSL